MPVRRFLVFGAARGQALWVAASMAGAGLLIGGVEQFCDPMTLLNVQPIPLRVCPKIEWLTVAWGCQEEGGGGVGVQLVRVPL